MYRAARFTCAAPSASETSTGQHILDEVQQHVGHVLTLGGCGRLEGVVQFQRDVQIHSLHFLFFNRFDRPHLLPPEVRLYGYEYGVPGKPLAPSPSQDRAMSLAP